jgi:hypothetical protein
MVPGCLGYWIVEKLTIFLERIQVRLGHVERRALRLCLSPNW